MATLRNHPGFWLRDDAAAAFDAYEAKYGVIGVNSAGRTVAQQQALIDRWNRGGAANRPPNLYKPAMPAPTSPHVIDGGIAVDVSDYRRFKQHSQEFGFYWYGTGDPVHFNFRGWNGGSGGGSVSQTVKNEQAFLNATRGERLTVDGIKGPATTAAYKRYQEYLRSRGWYTGAIDGVWGAGTQAAHAKYYAELFPPAPPTPSGNGTLQGLPWRGIQRMLKSDFGYTGAIDGIAGKGSVAAFQRFMNAKGYGRLAVDGIDGKGTLQAAQSWLKQRWGYGGAIDGIRGPGTDGAWARAEAANAQAYSRVN